MITDLLKWWKRSFEIMSVEHNYYNKIIFTGARLNNNS